MTWQAVASALTSFSFYLDTDKLKGLEFFETLKNRIYLKTILVSQGIICSLKFKTKKTNGWFVQSLILTLNKIIMNQGSYFVVIMNNHLKIVTAHGTSL